MCSKRKHGLSTERFPVSRLCWELEEPKGPTEGERVGRMVFGLRGVRDRVHV